MKNKKCMQKCVIQLHLQTKIKINKNKNKSIETIKFINKK